MTRHPPISAARTLLPALLLLTLPTRSALSQTPVTIYRDQVGIGHVYASGEQAVFYGLGRLHARDKPLATMMHLTWGSGNLAGTLGREQQIQLRTSRTSSSSAISRPAPTASRNGPRRSSRSMPPPRRGPRAPPWPRS